MIKQTPVRELAQAQGGAPVDVLDPVAGRELADVAGLDAFPELGGGGSGATTNPSSSNWDSMTWDQGNWS